MLRQPLLVPLPAARVVGDDVIPLVFFLLNRPVDPAVDVGDADSDEKVERDHGEADRDEKEEPGAEDFPPLQGCLVLLRVLGRVPEAPVVALLYRFGLGGYDELCGGKPRQSELHQARLVLRPPFLVEVPKVDVVEVLEHGLRRKRDDHRVAHHRYQAHDLHHVEPGSDVAEEAHQRTTFVTNLQLRLHAERQQAEGQSEKGGVRVGGDEKEHKARVGDQTSEPGVNVQVADVDQTVVGRPAVAGTAAELGLVVSHQRQYEPLCNAEHQQVAQLVHASRNGAVFPAKEQEVVVVQSWTSGQHWLDQRDVVKICKVVYKRHAKYLPRVAFHKLFC